MKAEVVEIKKKPEFEPIKIEITVENEDELRELWHRFNTPDGAIFDQAKHSRYPLKKVPSDRTMGIWSAIDNKLVSFNKEVR